MGSVCHSQASVTTFLKNTVSGIVFNDSDFEVQYSIDGTKSKTISQTVSKAVSADAKLSVNPANPLATGGEANAASKSQSNKQIKEENTQGKVWIKPHHYSNQGLVDLSLEKPTFFSISYWTPDDVEDNFHANVLVTCRESITFIITKDLACEPLDEDQVKLFKEQFDKDLDSRKAYIKETGKLNAHVKQLSAKSPDSGPHVPAKKAMKSGAAGFNY